MFYSLAPTLTKAYTVALMGAPGLSLAERISAEVRYAVELEERMGSDYVIARALQCQLARGTCAGGHTLIEQAHQAASMEATQGLRVPACAHFELRLAVDAGEEVPVL